MDIEEVKLKPLLNFAQLNEATQARASSNQELLVRLVNEYKAGRHSAVTKAIEKMATTSETLWPFAVSEAFGDKVEDTFVKRFAGAKEWTLTADQQKAWEKLQAWLKSANPFFALKGVGGSGKSFLVQKLLELDYNFYFSAPTNKASQVLSTFLREDVKTVYSLLGLRMVKEEDTMVLKPAYRPKDLGQNPIVVVDEAGMCNLVLTGMFEQLAERGWRFIFVGDPYQLNPIDERSSKVWKLTRDPENRVMMNEVKRFDNELLALSIKIRAAIKAREFDESPLADNNSNGQGVFMMTRRKMLEHIRSRTLDDWRDTKVAVWRNRTADKYTSYIRKNLGFAEEYQPGETILAAAPIVDNEDKIIAYTDEEFVIKSNTRDLMKLPEGVLDTTVLTLMDRDLKIVLCNDVERLRFILNQRATDAKRATKHERKYKWELYWKLKNAFHDIRYGYAMTTHRLQGSTYKSIYLDQADILANHNTMESFRMLYVAATRPTTSLISY